jgi:hypothetical protein
MCLEKRIEKLEQKIKQLEEQNIFSVFNKEEFKKQMFDSDTNFFNSINNLESYKNPIDVITSPIDNFDYSEYPDILGSWDQDFTPKLNTKEKKIQDVYGKIIYRFEVYHHEWECDGYGFIVIDKDKKYQLVLTDHGNAYISSLKELKNFINSYKDLIKKTEQACSFLE